MAALYSDVGAPAAQRLPQWNTSAFNTMPETGVKVLGYSLSRTPSLDTPPPGVLDGEGRNYLLEQDQSLGKLHNESLSTVIYCFS